MTTPVYQRNADATGRTLLTTKASEAVSAAKYGFTTDKGTPFYASSTPATGLVPIHRIYKASNNDFVWMPAGTELNIAVSKYGYVDQQVDFYASTTPSGTCTSPVYRLQKDGKHEFTVSKSQRDSMLASGWTEGSIAFYVTTKPAAALGTPYLNTASTAMKAYQAETDPAQKLVDYQLAITPNGEWFDGTRSTDDTWLKSLINKANTSNTVLPLVIYGIPGRDCGLYSAGGQADAASYKAWIDRVSTMVGNSKMMVVVEPDAISYCNNNATVRAERTSLLRYVGEKFKANNPNAQLYLHAGSGQLSYEYAVPAVKDAGIENYRGFAMNVASHGVTPVEESWAEGLVKKLEDVGIPNMHYVVDTSRNGVALDPNSNPGAKYLSCNNMTAAVGQRPTHVTTGENADAYMWVKHPGVSDGECAKGDPAAGVWNPSYAATLVNNAVKAGTINIIPMP